MTKAIDVLFIGAHPDDVEWGVGGIALLLQEQGVSFAIADLTQGEIGSRGTVDQRAVEAARAAEFLGASARENLKLPDGGLMDSSDNRRLIASVVRRYRPKIVLAPFWEDRHPDHAAAGLIVRNAALYCGLKNLDDPNPPHRPAAFLYYPLHQFQKPSFVVDTTAIFPRKLELLGVFASQFAASVGDYLFALESRDRYFGLQIGARTAEALLSDQPIRLGGLSDLLPDPAMNRRFVWKALLAVIGFAAVLYGCDFVYAWARKAPFADVHIERYLAIAQNFNKISYEHTDPVTERCVYSIYPHFGYTPCWYLMRHTVRFIKIG